MYQRQVYSLKIAGIKAKVSDHGNGTVTALTLPSDAVHSGALTLMMLDELDEYIVHSDAMFRYLPDPKIYAVENLKTVLSGGTRLMIHGENLNSVARPYVIVTREYRGNYTTYVSLCDVRNLTTMTCTVPDMSRDLELANVTDWDITELGIDREKLAWRLLPDSAQTGEPLPRKKRSTSSEDDDVIVKRLEQKFFIGFKLDGVTEYKNFSVLPVFRDPLYFRFDEPDHVRHFHRDHVFLRIKGRFLNKGVTVADMMVFVGGATCNITSLHSNQLTCIPPPEKPEHGLYGYGPRHSHMVVVKVGTNLIYVVGYLKYPDPTAADTPKETTEKQRSVLKFLIAILIGVFALWVLTLVLALLICGKRRPHTRKNKFYLGHDPGELPEISDYATPADTLGFTDMNGNEVTGYENSIEIVQVVEVFSLLDDVMKQNVTSCSIDSKRLQLEECIGKGHFGKVYKGMLTHGKEKEPDIVAVKTLHGTSFTEADMLSFLEEALIMRGFKHGHVLMLYGVVVNDVKPYVVLEYMDKGDLRAHLANADHTFTMAQLIKYGEQSADGMAYLTENSFIHRDLAARNCMVNSMNEVKIADFGLSRDLYGSDYYQLGDSRRALPVRWMAIESLNMGRFTAYSDVWSFGILLWEIFTRGGRPYAHVDNFNLKEHINEGHRLQKPPDAPDTVYDVMNMCWMETPEDRPTFRELKVKLSQILADNPTYWQREYLTVLA